MLRADESIDLFLNLEGCSAGSPFLVITTTQKTLAPRVFFEVQDVLLNLGLENSVGLEITFIAKMVFETECGTTLRVISMALYDPPEHLCALSIDSPKNII